MSTYIRSLLIEVNVDVVPVVRPGTQGQVAGLHVERPRAQVEVAEHLELRRRHPHHLPIGVRDAVRVSVVVHHVASRATN